MQTITLSDETANRLHTSAVLRGLDRDTYAEELLATSLAVLRTEPHATFPKTPRAMELSGIFPSGRTAAQIDAAIEAARAEWDESSDTLPLLAPST